MLRCFGETCQIWRKFWLNRNLIKNLIYRDVSGRYKGSLFGVFWSLVTPVLMLTVYTFVFSVVFKARWSGGTDSKSEYALLIFSGLLVFNLFAECISRAPSIVINNANYVKKVVFPLEILPVVALGSSLFHFCIGCVVWLLAYLLLIGPLHWTIVILPLLVIQLSLWIIGVSWVLASLGVYVRDVGQLIGILIQILMFISPIFYPSSALPVAYQKVMDWNPMTYSIEAIRQIMYTGEIPNMNYLSMNLALSMLVAIIGLAWFEKTRRGFADVL